MGAHCVVSMIVDTDRHNAFVAACMVHTAHAPCTHDGEPANPTPLHGWTDQPRSDSVDMWEIRTQRQRPLVIHNGSPADTTEHQVGTDADCWCMPEVLAAVVASWVGDATAGYQCDADVEVAHDR